MILIKLKIKIYQINQNKKKNKKENIPCQSNKKIFNIKTVYFNII